MASKATQWISSAGIASSYRAERPPLEVVRSAIAPSIESTRAALFSPVKLNRWLNLGFIAFLAWLWQGIGLQRLFSTLSTGPLDSARALLEDLSAMLAWSAEHFILTILIGVVAIPALAAFCTALIWLSSRGQVMFVHAVSQNDPRVKVNWRSSAEQGRSVFRFQFAFNGSLFVLAAAIFVLLLGQSLTLGDGGRMVFLTLLQSMYPIAILAMPLGLAFVVVNMLMRDFVTPIMICYNIPCVQAWSRLGDIVQDNPKTILLYLVARTVLFAMIGAATFVVAVFTCGLGLIPYVGHVLVLPIYVFDRAYPLHVLLQVLPDFTIGNLTRTTEIEHAPQGSRCENER